MPENDIKPEAGQPDGLKLKKNYYEPQAEVEQDIRKNQAEPGSPAGIPMREARSGSIAGRHQHGQAFTSFSSKSNAPQRRRQKLRLAAGWLFFIVLGGGLVYIRFFLNAPGLAPDLLKQYGMIAVGIVYLVSIFLAIKDNMFDGLLAIVVPFYPFYYLFFKCGSVFLCALAAALLAAFGFDCLLFIQNIALKLIGRVEYWMQHV